MGGWGSGPGMIQEPELEEGEACYYKDDTSIDPDISLSYIEDKVQTILGHLRKDFEGGVTAENLGPKFGGYGSFLPVHQRSPSIWSQPKSPQRVQNSNLPGSHNHLFSEGPAPNSVKVLDAPSTQRNAPLSSDQVSETLPGKVELLPIKADNSINHRTLKVRIKVGPDRMAQYNAALDSLGLASPLSSAENSPEESGGLPFESNMTPNDSPTYILQIMTSFPVPGGSLLSPLSEDLLNIVKETDSSVGTEYESAPKSSAISDRLLKTNVIESKRTKSVDISKKNVKSENECTLDLNECKETNSGSQTLDCKVQPFHDLNYKHLSDTDRESENKVQLKKMRGSKDRVKGKTVSSDLVKANSLEHISDQSSSRHMRRESKCDSVEIHRGRMSQKDSASDHGQEGRSDANLNRASLRAYSDISEVRRITGALDKTNVKVLQPAAGEEDGLEVPRTLNKLSFEKKSKVSQSSGQLASKFADSLRYDDNAAPKNKYSAKKDVQRPKLVPERPSGGRPKNLDLDKAKAAYSDKLKEMSNNRNSFDNLTSQTYTAEPPAADVTLNLGTNSGLEQTLAPLPDDQWVLCDRCAKWRLLPCGMEFDFPDKWFCRMQKWLPGLNRCDISEDETTRLIQASYSTPVPVNQFNVKAHADKRMSGVSSDVAPRLDQNQQNFASDQIPNLVKKQKLKEMQKPVSMSDPVSSSNGEKNLQQRVLTGSSKEENQSLAGEIATNKSNLQHSNKSQILSAKSNKRKDVPVIGDDANPKKKIKKEYADGMVTKIKSKGALNLENNPGHSLTSGLPNKESLKEGMKQNLQQDSISGGKGKIQIYLKKPKDQMQDLPDNGREVSTKKRRVKDREDSQHQVERLQNNGSDLQGRKEETKDSGIHRDKKSRGSEVEERELKKYKVDDVSKRKCAEARVRLSGSKENPNNSGIEKEQEVRKLRAKPQLTLEDIDKLRKDLGCEQFSTAANSSSSKVSDTRKIRIRYKEVRGSPQESVSSSPARITNPDQISPIMMQTFGKVNSSTKNFSASGSAKKCLDLKPKVDGSSIEKISGQKEPWNGKVRLDLRQRDKNGVPCPSKLTTSLGSKKRSCEDSRQFDSSVIGETPKAIKDKSIACHQNGSDIRHNEAEQSVALDTSLANKNFSNITASTTLKEAEDVLREAEEIKVHADLIKNSGFSSESNYEYFKAALKFLQGASLLEACNGSSKHMEMNPVQVYGTAAKICKACASDYEKGHQLAAAALAYKCVEVAYLRIVNCKSSTMYRVWHDLQSTLQMVSQGESPSSSASDVDNFNNLAMADKNTLSKGNVSHSGNQVILPRNRSNFVRLLDFTKDMNSAMEATKKSQDTFAVARVKLEESQNKEGIVSVKSVIHFSFQDIDELIRLIWLALNAINQQGLGGCRD